MARHEDQTTALTASLLSRNGELFGIDCRHLQAWRFGSSPNKNYIPTAAIEEILIDTLISFLSVAKNDLALKPPLEVSIGFNGIKGYRLAVDRMHFGDDMVGRIFIDSIGKIFSIQNYEEDPFDMLLPVFEEIYDSAGIKRPDSRTIGRSQRE